MFGSDLGCMVVIKNSNFVVIEVFECLIDLCCCVKIEVGYVGGYDDNCLVFMNV